MRRLRALHGWWHFARYPTILQVTFKQWRYGWRVNCFLHKLVRSAGQIIWDCGQRFFEEIWEGNLLQSGSVGDQWSATHRRWRHCQVTPQEESPDELGMCALVCLCVWKKRDRKTAASDIPLAVIQLRKKPKITTPFRLTVPELVCHTCWLGHYLVVLKLQLIVRQIFFSVNVPIWCVNIQFSSCLTLLILAIFVYYD